MSQVHCHLLCIVLPGTKESLSKPALLTTGGVGCSRKLTQTQLSNRPMIDETGLERHYGTSFLCFSSDENLPQSHGNGLRRHKGGSREQSLVHEKHASRAGVRWPHASIFKCTDLPQMAKSANSVVSRFFIAQKRKSPKIQPLVNLFPLRKHGNRRRLPD